MSSTLTVVTTEVDEQVQLPPHFRDLPDKDDLPVGERPSTIYPDCPHCPAYVEPDDEYGAVCIACGTTPLGVLAIESADPPDTSIGPFRNDERETYRISKRVRLAGGFEEPYPDEHTKDPEYEFLSR